MAAAPTVTRFRQQIPRYYVSHAFQSFEKRVHSIGRETAIACPYCQLAVIEGPALVTPKPGPRA